MKHCSILVVCTDNLCRSPMAEEIIRQKAQQLGLGQQVFVASAATHDLNVGEPADIRAQKHAMRREYDLSRFRARLLEADDFARFDRILAVDESTLVMLRLLLSRACWPLRGQKKVLHFCFLLSTYFFSLKSIFL